MNIHSNTTTTSQVTASVGFQITGASTAGRYLRHNGTRYVDAAIQTADIPGLGANPSASVGLSAVNGVATTYLRSDSSPALSVAITPTWTGTHTFSNATYSALFSGGPTGFGIATPVAGIDVETVPASSSTYGKFGTTYPLYMVSYAGGAGNPALGFNAYYATAKWRFGKGSSSSYCGVWALTTATGALDWYISSAGGAADAEATIASIFSISAAGVVKVPGLTASRLVATDGSSNLSSVAGVQRLHTDATNHFDTTGSSTNVDLGSYTLPADQLQAVGDSFHAEFIGKQTNTVQTKNLNLYFNGVDYGGFTNTTATDWAFVVDGVVTDATAANSTVRLTYRLYLGSTFSVVVNDITGLDLSATKVLKLVSNTVSTGTTPYNEEYIFLCDFIAAP